MFITFEGPEGAGKSTQLALLAASLRNDGYRVITTREPGGTPLGEAVRALVLQSNVEPVPAAEALLFEAARAQLVQEVIEPALRYGQIVLCDRFTDSTLAYQGYGRKLPLSSLGMLNDYATGPIKPDLTVLLDLDIEVGLDRKPSNEINRLDLDSIFFHQRVRAGFQILAAQQPKRWLMVDATRSIEEVQNTIARAVHARLMALRAGKNC